MTIRDEVALIIDPESIKGRESYAALPGFVSPEAAQKAADYQFGEAIKEAYAKADAILALSPPEPISPDLLAVLKAVEQRLNESGTGEMGLLDTIHAVYALVKPAIAKAESRAMPLQDHGKPFQTRVVDWLMACFSMEVCRDRIERNHRFLEESLELVQSLGCTRSEAHQLVDYVFGRPAGDPKQELGGVMVTAAALCWPNELDLNDAAETELARVWEKIDLIRAKQLAKPKHSPLPAMVAEERTDG